MLMPFVEVLSAALTLYGYVVFAWIIVSLLVNFEILNRYNPIAQKIVEFLTKATEPALAPIRKIIPPIAGIDISPIILFLILRFIQSALWNWVV